jgi:septal ring factor EnvC (AmiA/AmiB activator)
MDNMILLNIDARHLETIVALLIDRVEECERAIRYARQENDKATDKIADLKENLEMLREENAKLRAMLAKIDRFANSVEVDDE